MKDSEKSISPFSLIERYARVLTVLWTVIVVASLTWSIIRIKQETIEGARIQAHISYVKDILYRRWNTEHGGVYVPVTEKTIPNPYLQKIPEREIKTLSGKTLTLINPAYMTRQVNELMKDEYGIYVHITSLRPIRPENAPDPWEAEALMAFEQGKTEISSITKVGGKDYFRLMHPFVTEKGCLKCHAEQGYSEGDVRGGISVSIPMKPSIAMERRNIFTFSVVHGLLWIAGLAGIHLSMQRIRKSEQDRVYAEEGLRKKTEELGRSNADLQQFAYAASHDLQEPLRAVAGFARLLEKRYRGKLDPDADGYIAHTIEGVKRMQAIIKDLLDYSQIGNDTEKSISADTALIVTQAIFNLKGAIEESGAVITHDELPAVKIGEVQMLRLFQNLIGNAIKFRGKEAPKIHISSEKRGDELIFSVRDNGIGINPEQAKRIFIIFQRLHTKEAYPGTGIGLALCKKIVEHHGGRIWVESEAGKGAIFYFTLPAA